MDENVQDVLPLGLSVGEAGPRTVSGSSEWKSEALMRGTL